MKGLIVLITAAGALSGIPASASPCSDKFTTMEAKLREKAEAAISSSTGGKAVSAAREARAMQNVEEPPEHFRGQKQAAEDMERAEDAGDAGDDVLEAEVALKRAQELDKEGDIAGCQAALAEVEKKLASSGE